jgi:hypothetical protein
VGQKVREEEVCQCNRASPMPILPISVNLHRQAFDVSCYLESDPSLDHQSQASSGMAAIRSKF